MPDGFASNLEQHHTFASSVIRTKMKCGRNTLKQPQSYFPVNLKLGDYLLARPRANRYHYLWQTFPTRTKQSVPMISLVFSVDSPAALADLMQSMLDKSWQPTGKKLNTPASPFAPDWTSLWGLLTDGLASSNSNQMPLSGVIGRGILLDE